MGDDAIDPPQKNINNYFLSLTEKNRLRPSSGMTAVLFGTLYSLTSSRSAE